MGPGLPGPQAMAVGTARGSCCGLTRRDTSPGLDLPHRHDRHPAGKPRHPVPISVPPLRPHTIPRRWPSMPWASKLYHLLAQAPPPRFTTLCNGYISRRSDAR